MKYQNQEEFAQENVFGLGQANTAYAKFLWAIPTSIR